MELPENSHQQFNLNSLSMKIEYRYKDKPIEDIQQLFESDEKIRNEFPTHTAFMEAYLKVKDMPGYKLIVSEKGITAEKI